MIVECGYCGAPLDVREGARYTKCIYCKKTSERQLLKTIDVQTPKNWRPPPVWRPPAHVPADSNIQLQAGSAVAGGAILAFVLLAITGAVVAGVVSSKRKISSGPGSEAYPGGPKRIDPALLAKITLKESPEALAKLTGVAMDDQKSIRVPVAHPAWEAVTFRYDPDHLDHVKDFYFNATSTPSLDARKNLKTMVGRRWEKDGFSWEGCSIYAADKGNHIGGNITIDLHGKEKGENPIWREQAETLWKLARKAAFDVGDMPKKQEMRDTIGLGYTLADLAKLNLDADIDHADEAMKAVFPGAVRNLFIDLEYKIAIDHPWYSSAEINWANKKGAQVKELELRPPVGLQKFANQQAVFDCVTAAFGKPERIYEGEHLGGSKDATWKPANGGYIRVYEHMIMVYVREYHWAKPMPKDVFIKTVTTLDQCGKGSP